MRRPLVCVLLASALTLWIDGLLWVSGDAGPVGWSLEWAVPQLFVLPSLAAALYALRNRAWAASTLGLTVAGIQVFGPLGLCLGSGSDEPAALRVATYNVEKFGAGYAAVAATIRATDADVVCLQEAGLDREGFPMPKEFPRLLPEYRCYAAHGMAILSKRPFRNARTHRFDTPMGLAGWNLQEITLDVGGRPIRVFSVHMMPQGYQPDPPLGPYPFLKRVETARRYREAELDEVISRTQGGPVVLCGDFNQQPFGPRYRRLAGAFTDSFRATGRGFGYTLRSNLPTKRVDYVWTRGLRPLRTRVGGRRTSDHLPVVADLMSRSASRPAPIHL